MTNVHFHPSDDTLARYAAGDLDPASSIMMSAHLEYCINCRLRIDELEASYTQVLESTPAEPMTCGLTEMLSQILSQPAEPLGVEPVPISGVLKLDNKEFHLPRALQRHKDEIGPWSRLPGKIQRAYVSTGGKSKMNFIYMEPDSALPEHTHQGLEITLVLSGRFTDEHASYGPGDFIVQTTEHQHSPKTRPGQDCLCLTLLDAPLHFTSGLATLLNPFSQLFFRC
ncbi:ChrR family anti-sigma-E factor [Photobacterium lipolyticum]|uniref:Transcriptional activator ChrR n=1 Tax=Photobacterium lipolyticum TaxID=266810 RepID=A0A2T3N330_9GAMM|nr:ChrR family anti-sigma-E factor [Photobacterium lipolyticum]PSW06786.1 transcriptional activator ChrR [Photobacterium lipolyticum]